LAKDYYEILGVAKDADQEEIKKAYRTLSKEHHPDHGGDAEKFKELSEAYSVLSNPEKRQNYDNPMRNMGNPFEDIFRNFGGSFGRRRPPNPNAPRRGRNIVIEQEIPIRLFILGGKIKVSFKLRDLCTDCNGTGAEETITCSACSGSGQIIEGRQMQGVFMQSSRPCPTCSGRGFRASKECKACQGQGNKEVEKNLEVELQPGTREGQAIGITGQGGSGANGGSPGDLIIKVYIKYPDPNKLTEEQKKVLEEL
jgi:molecular chaperone DnaJ